MKSKVLGKEDVEKILKDFIYYPLTGEIYHKEHGSGHHESHTTLIKLLDGSQTNMPVTKLAYILAYGACPVRRVTVRRGLGIPRLAKDSLIAHGTHNRLT
jgi:hypothetical protein